MSNNTGGPAFPESGPRGQASGGEGMTLRDYFAAKAMQSAFVESSFGFTLEDYRQLAQVSYAMADAMLKARG